MKDRIKFMIFILLVLIGAIVSTVVYVNSEKKCPKKVDISTDPSDNGDPIQYGGGPCETSPNNANGAAGAAMVVLWIVFVFLLVILWKHKWDVTNEISGKQRIKPKSKLYTKYLVQKFDNH